MNNLQFYDPSCLRRIGPYQGGVGSPVQRRKEGRNPGLSKTPSTLLVAATHWERSYTSIRIPSETGGRLNDREQPAILYCGGRRLTEDTVHVTKTRFVKKTRRRKADVRATLCIHPQKSQPSTPPSTFALPFRDLPYLHDMDWYRHGP